MYLTEAVSPKEVEKYLKLNDKTVKKVFSQLVDVVSHIWDQAGPLISVGGSG
ncbi:hypothetical protein [Bacillus sp. UNC438CL73TsuS30]|uniref:hypothetical protein n=1 Tax=Bacillus sp. UNC438CL73TsuS30 TaxID=1340434 RepID=UPI000AC80EAA|nr:hypothetical protein [Bacillus sp. UNC438CL73TsuS30]